MCVECVRVCMCVLTVIARGIRGHDWKREEEEEAMPEEAKLRRTGPAKGHGRRGRRAAPGRPEPTREE